MMIAGGAEELSAADSDIFDTLYAASTKNDAPKTTPSPFSKERDGLVIGEGAGTLILEEYEHAKARGAKIFAEIIGFGTNQDGNHITTPNQATFHFIGHLQTNKVKYVVGKAALIHSVDSERLLRAIDVQADKLGLRQDILLEVNVAGEESKGGVSPEDLPDLAELAASCPQVRLRGLMAIPPVSTVSGSNRKYFSQMRNLFVDIMNKMSDNQSVIDCLSMASLAQEETI